MRKKIGLFTRSYSYREFLEFQRHSKHKDHFDVSFKQTFFEKNNSSDSYRHVFISVEKICFAFGENMK
jgi:hypothetical protein